MQLGVESAAPEARPGPGRFRVRLVGDADAVAWVEANLRGPGLGVEAVPFEAGGEPSELPGQIVWVARPGEPEPGRSLVDDAAVWSFPCLVVIPPGGAAPDILAGHPSVESFEVVREPDDAPVLRMRLERLLLLHRRRSQTEAVLHDLPVGVYTRTLDGVVTSVNAEMEAFLGKGRTSVVGRPLLDALPRGSITERHLHEMNEGLLARGRHRMRIAGRVPDGRRFALDTRALLLRDGHGTPWGAQVVIADLTDEEEAQERLRVEAERNQTLAAIATATRDMVELDRVLETATGVVGTFTNARSVNVFLLDDGGRRLALRHSWRHDEDVPSPAALDGLVGQAPVFDRIVAGRTPFVVADAAAEDVFPAAGRALRDLGAGSGVLLPIVAGNEFLASLGLTWAGPRAFPPDELAFLSLVADQLALAIRAARLYASLEEKLRALAEEQRLRERADHDRQRLLSMLVHDLKNPLAAVLASLELALERTADDRRLERLLKTATASARGLSGMIDDALLVYRTGEAPADLRTEDVGSVLAQPFEEARFLAEARQIRLYVDAAEPIPPVAIDAGRYRRAASNILSNALKFSRRGGDVEASVRIEEASGARWLVFRVADSGPGIPESVKDRLAQPYQRFAGSERVPGTGLGLTVVVAVAAAHGGCVNVEPRASAAGGSVFSLWVPA